ncbi:MAG: hypothetical protein QGI83_06785 [Candidatus Latescibacteria bacterium]|jgi:L-seryl-tRNA(Ser) seleniumtransferase|nr:hypothetical protein [Candidatus Latescibacterota bacterium]
MVSYDDLGMRPFINASGTITTLGGSLMPREALEAMRDAASAFVDLNELNVKAGEYLAKRIGVEAAFVSCGAASGMQLSAAACLTGNDLEKVRSLPHTEGWSNEFVISLVDSHTYIHQGIEVCGGRLVRVGSKTEVTAADLAGGIGEKTAAVVHFLGKQSKEQLGEVIPEADKKGVPVIVDAAAQLPPRTNLTEIVEMGTSLVVFSGGKGLYGPQDSGLVLGKASCVDAVRLNASPYSAIGRGMKVGKEEIMGLIAAVDLFLSRTDEEDRTVWRRRMEYVVDALLGVPGVEAYVLGEGQQASPDFAPRAYVDLDDPKRAREVIQAMRDGNPSVVIRPSGKGVVVDPMTLMPGEEEIVARRLKEVLGA